MMGFHVETGMFKADERRLHLFSSVALPSAVKFTVDQLAAKTSNYAKAHLSKYFTLRNTWTKRSIRYEKSLPTKDISQIVSYAGSTAEYMAKQQLGFKEMASGKHGIPIPTAVASGEGQVSRRERPVLKQSYLKRLSVARGIYNAAARRSKTPAQHFATAAALAREQGKKFMYWKSASTGREGLVSVSDTSRADMVYNLSRKAITSNPREWLSTAGEAITPLLKRIYGSAIRFQLSKLK